MQLIVKNLLLHKLGTNLNLDIFKPFSKILILDSSSWKIPNALADCFPGFNSNGTKAMCKLQLAYDFLKGQIDFFEIYKGTSNDNAYAYTETNLKLIERGSLVIADLGYFSTKFLSTINSQGAFFVSRLKYDANVYCPVTKQPIDLLKLIKATNVDNFELKVLIKSRTCGYCPCRLVVQRVPELIAEQRRRKKNERKKNMKKKTSEMCSWTMMITNLEEKEMPANLIYHFYRIRWQIELIFKQFKSILQIHKVNTGKKERLLCEVYGKMIFATLIIKIHGQLNALEWNLNKQQVSLEKFIKQVSKQVINFHQIIKNNSFKEIVNYFLEFLNLVKPYYLKSEHEKRPSTLTLLTRKQDSTSIYLCPALVLALS